MATQALFLAPPRLAEAAPAEPDLTARALRGDIVAWNALIGRHNHRVVVTLLGRGVAIERAKDIAQDAWLRLIEQQRAGNLRELKLPALAVTQAIFLSIDAARRDGRERATRDDDAADVADPCPAADLRMMSEERLALAEKVLGKCPPSARKVFELAYGGEGLSHADIASRVGLSTQRVRQIVCEVRKLLRAAMDGGSDE
jgi:RNA polymerase sigma factor (sigma-70 family)